jgi:RNase P subunit RPR2
MRNVTSKKVKDVIAHCGKCGKMTDHEVRIESHHNHPFYENDKRYIVYRCKDCGTKLYFDYKGLSPRAKKFLKR